MKLSLFLMVTFSSALLSAEEITAQDEEPILHGDETISHGDETISHDDEAISHGDETVLPDVEDSVTPDESFMIEADMVGHFSSNAQFDTRFDRDNEDIVEWTQRLKLEIDVRTSREWNFFLSGEMMHWTGGKKNEELVNLYINPAKVRTQFDVQLGESYAQYQKGKWNIKAGNLITRWGSTDISRPSDIINPVDRTRALTKDASMRLPQLGADLKYVFESFSAQIIFVPFFVPDRSFTFGRDSSFLAADISSFSNLPVTGLIDSLVDRSNEEFVQSALIASERPDEDPTNISIGGRLSTTLWNADLSLGYFFGWDRTPSLYLDSDLRALGEAVLQDGQFLRDLDIPKFLGRNDDGLERFSKVRNKVETGGTLAESKFSRLHMLSLDGARYFGEFGVRFEVAVHPEKTFVSETLATIRRPFLNAALGLSYEKIESEDDAFTVVIEGFYSEADSFDGAFSEYFVSDDERGSRELRLLFGSRNYGLITNVVWELPWLDMQAQMGGRLDLSRQDILVAGSVEYRWTPRFKSSVGLTFFEPFGDMLSVGRAFDHNDFVWIRSEAIF